MGAQRGHHFQTGGLWNLMAIIIFELQITVMLYLDFHRGIVLQDFYVSVAFFKTVRECQNAAL